MTVVYDTGLLVAAERNDQRVLTEHSWRVKGDELVLVPAPVVAQASRTVRQARLHRLLRTCDIVPFAADDAHEVGALLARSGTSDVVDAHVAVLAARLGARIITSDLDDLGHLASYLEPRVAVVPV